MQVLDSGQGPGMFAGIPLEDFDALDNNRFAQEWKTRFQLQRIQMIPEIGRWLKVLRYFAPRRLEDHWQDQFGMPLPKLAEAEGLSVMIANWCQPFIEVYGSLLAGQKPWPFMLDVRPYDSKSPSELFRADAQEKLIMLQMEQQAIPLHFLDFCTSLMLFGIGWVFSWIDRDTRALKTQAISWPGDAVPQFGSNRYGRGSDALESIIFTENVAIDTAQRLYPDTEFIRGSTDVAFRPDSVMQTLVPGGITQILKIWYRWHQPDDPPGTDKIGYGEVALSGTTKGSPATLYREDDTEYPGIPAHWASRFMNPGEAPYKSAGILDNVIGINTEYDERLSAFSDLIMKFVYPKLKGKNYNVNTAPRLDPKQNIVPLGPNQDINLIQDIIQGGQGYFDSFLNRMESFMLTSVGLSRLMMGSLPPGETSGEALNNLLHSSIARLEVVRTPIQWCWLALLQDTWIPLLYKWGSYSAVDGLTGRKKKTDLKQLFDTFAGFVWTWPDVTPRDALRQIQTTMDLVNGGMLSRESGMERIRIGSPVDELAKIRAEYQDPVLNADKARLTKMVEMMSAPQQSASTGVKVSLSGVLSPEETVSAAEQVGITGAPPQAVAPGAAPGGKPAPGGQPGKPNEKQFAQAKNDNLKAKAAATPAKTNAENTAMTARQGSESNAAQGARSEAGGPGVPL